MSDPVLEHLRAKIPSVIERIPELVRCSSVSTDPAYAEGMEEAEY